MPPPSSPCDPVAETHNRPSVLPLLHLPRGCTFQIRFITAEVGRRILRALARLFTSRYVNTSSRIRASFLVLRDVKSQPILRRTRSRRHSFGLADRSRCLITVRPILDISPRVCGHFLCRGRSPMRVQIKEREKYVASGHLVYPLCG